MSPIPSDDARRIPPDSDPMDDIEILEVVGLDEDGVPVEEDAAPEDDVEVVFEEPGASDAPDPAASDAPPAAVETAETREFRERLLRLQADFENFKKRIDRERLDHLRHATSDLLARLLPVLDNFERAIASFRPGSSAEAVIEGVNLIHRQLLQELEKEGLRGMESVGETFDPLRHEAVATETEGSAPPHAITHVFQRGYFLHDRLLRPAMVRVRVEDGDGAPAPDGKES